MKTRMEQAKLFVMDEMSMIGRQMLGKIEFKIRNTLYDDTRRLGEEMTVAGRRVMTTLGGKDVVMSGDFKQANPIGDDPMYKLGDYVGKGQNKPKHAERTPDGAWTTKNLCRMGMAVRDQFEDGCLLRQVHRHNEKKDGLSDAEQEKYRQDADRYRRVMKGMADCDPALFTKDDHAWLSGFNRSVLQQTEAGRRHLRVVDGSEGGKPAPLLMDGRKDTINGAMGATKINVMKLERVSAAMKKPIGRLLAFLHQCGC